MKNSQEIINRKPIGKFILASLILMMGVLLINSVVAFDFDNTVKYSNDSMKIDINNCNLWVGTCLIEGAKLGTATLESHTAVDVPRIVPLSDSGVNAVMWYEMNFTNAYTNGLGDVKFTDLYTGKPETKKYHYVQGIITGYETVYDTGKCTSVIGKNGTYDSCEQIKRLIPQYKWETISGKDILKGDNIIGIVVDDLVFGESFDAVFTIAGQEITKHAPVSVYDAHGKSATTDTHGEPSKKFGLWITPKLNITLQEAVINSPSFTKCYVINSSSDIIETETPVDINVTLYSNLTQNQRYAIACNGSVTTWKYMSWDCDGGGTGTNLNWSMGYEDGYSECSGLTGTRPFGNNIVGIRSIQNQGSSFTFTNSLNSPVDNYKTVTKTNWFSTDLNIVSGNLTNATLQIWNGTGALTYTNFTTISGASNSTNLSMKLAVGNYTWNYYACGVNSSAVSCINANASRAITITPPVFGLCNSTNNVSYLNYSFEDETTFLHINATMIGSFMYYDSADDSSTAQTYSVTSTDYNYSYPFCSISDSGSIKVKSDFQYASVGYPSRILNPGGYSTYTSATTNTTLYLLSTANGIYTSFQVINYASNPLQGVSVNATENNAYSITQSGITDSAGIITLFLNPIIAHIVTAFLTGYPISISTITPTQTSYTIMLGTNTSINPGVETSKGVYTNILPASQYLSNKTTYSFNFTINSTYYGLNKYGILIQSNSSTDLASSNGTTATGGIINVNINTGENTTLYLTTFYNINGTITYLQKTYTILSSQNSQWGVSTLFSDLSGYLASGGFFGLQMGFGMNIIIFMIIFLITGIVSWKFGLYSPMAVAGIIFALVYIFDWVLGLITEPITHMTTFITVIALAAIIIKEVSSY